MRVDRTEPYDDGLATGPIRTRKQVARRLRIPESTVYYHECVAMWKLRNGLADLYGLAPITFEEWRAEETARNDHLAM